MNQRKLAEARRLYHHVCHGGTLTPEDVSFMVVALEEAYERREEHMTYEEALQIAMEELDEKIEYLSDTFKGYPVRIEDYIYSLSMARKALIKASEEKREWVGLSEDELENICDGEKILFGQRATNFIRSIEAKLKEKNT